MTLSHIASRYIKFNGKMASWQEKLHAPHDDALYWTTPSQLYDQVGGMFTDDCFHRCICFSDLSTAHLLLLHCTASLLLKSVLFIKCQVLRKVANENVEVIDTSSNVVEGNDLHTCHYLVYRIALSVEFFT